MHACIYHGTYRPSAKWSIIRAGERSIFDRPRMHAQAANVEFLI
jgi:hypothetical protein